MVLSIGKVMGMDYVLLLSGISLAKVYGRVLAEAWCSTMYQGTLTVLLVLRSTSYVEEAAEKQLPLPSSQLRVLYPWG